MELKKSETVKTESGMEFIVSKDVEFTKAVDKDEAMKPIIDCMQTAYTGCLEAESEAEYHAVSLAVLSACDGSAMPGYIATLIGIAGCITASWINALDGEYETFEAKKKAACISLAKNLRKMRDGYAQLVDSINSKIAANGGNS